jgi:hypothetical protein
MSDPDRSNTFQSHFLLYSPRSMSLAYASHQMACIVEIWGAVGGPGCAFTCLGCRSCPTGLSIHGDQRTQSQTLLQLAHQQQTTVGGDAGALEINFQTGVKRELKG